MKRILSVFSILSLCALLSPPSQAVAQNGTITPNNGPSTNFLIGPANPLTLLDSYEIRGDYIAAGDGMYGVGGGSINLSIPAGASLYKAYLFWAIIWDVTPPSSGGMLNSNAITGTLLGTSGTPCRFGTSINFYWADVTSYALSGMNSLSAFPSSVGVAETEGATLVLVFEHPMWDYNMVALYGGATTFASQGLMESVGTYTGYGPGNPMDVVAQHTYIMSDGQPSAAGGATKFNGTATSGPTTAIMPLDAFPGADGDFWDTHTLDVSTFFPNGISTNADPEASSVNDCLTWGGHVISVKSALNAFVDIKPASCPNSFNVNSKGNLPVAILGSAGFNVSNIDPSTVELNGVPASGGISMSDVSTPFVGELDDCMDCNAAGPDGMTDRVFHFNSQAVAATLGNVATNDCVVATITGELMDGTPFSGSDILRIINNGPKDAPEGLASFELALDQNSPNPFVDGTNFSYSIPNEGIVNLAVYNALGQKVATILHGTQTAGSHNASWNGFNDLGARVAPGVYLYRLETGSQSVSKKLLISK